MDAVSRESNGFTEEHFSDFEAAPSDQEAFTAMDAIISRACADLDAEGREYPPQLRAAIQWRDDYKRGV